MRAVVVSGFNTSYCFSEFHDSFNLKRLIAVKNKKRFLLTGFLVLKVLIVRVSFMPSCQCNR